MYFSFIHSLIYKERCNMQKRKSMRILDCDFFEEIHSHEGKNAL